MTPPEPPRKRPTANLRAFALAIELPFVLVGGVLIGGGLGYLLDHLLGTGQILTLIFGFLGFAGGVREVMRRIPKDDDGGNAPQ